MNNELNNWDKLKQKYLEQVEKVLAKTEHPRKNEVLEDVAAHLQIRYSELVPEQITDEKLQDIIDQMGPASDYAELLEPATGGRVKIPYINKKLLLVLIPLALLVAVSLVRSAWDHPHYGCRLRELFGCNYIANPFFSEDNFEKVTTGMNKDQVRDLIGCPYRRWQPLYPPSEDPNKGIWKEMPADLEKELLKDEIRWLYTAKAFDGANSFTEYCVRFRDSTGLVLDSEKHTGTTGSQSSMNLRLSLFPKEVGELEVSRFFAGERHVLQPQDKQVSIVLMDFCTGRQDLEEHLVHYKDHAENILTDIGVPGVSIYYLDDNAKTRLFGDRHRELDIRHMVYYQGELYAVPDDYSDYIHKEDIRDDQKWFLRRLTEKVK